MNDFSAKKSLGQHWLNDTQVLDNICEAAEIQAGDRVLEIGPGKGSLTSRLLLRKVEVFAVEFDIDSVDYLRQLFAIQWDVNLHVEQGDIRTFNLERLPSPYKLVANIPYYLTSHLIQIISESNNPPSVAVLLVQKEVAERIAAKPSDMSLLSVASQFYWEVSLGELVPADLFDPAPKVDSQVVIMKRREDALFQVNEKKFFSIVKSGFSAKRKTLLNSLSGGLRLDKNAVTEILDATGIDLNLRAQNLDLDDWYKIYKELDKQL